MAACTMRAPFSHLGRWPNGRGGQTRRSLLVVTAYILIQTEVGKAAQVAKEIAEIKGVESAEDVTGPYDVIVRAEARNVDDLGKLVGAGVLERQREVQRRREPAPLRRQAPGPLDRGGREQRDPQPPVGAEALL